LELGSCFFCPDQLWPQSSYFRLLVIAGMAGVHPTLNIFSLKCLENFLCLGWLWTMILLLSASQVDRITGVSHWSQLILLIIDILYSLGWHDTILLLLLLCWSLLFLPSKCRALELDSGLSSSESQ
jgi:hypothetical protein